MHIISPFRKTKTDSAYCLQDGFGTKKGKKIQEETTCNIDMEMKKKMWENNLPFIVAPIIISHDKNVNIGKKSGLLME